MAKTKATSAPVLTRRQLNRARIEAEGELLFGMIAAPAAGRRIRIAVD